MHISEHHFICSGESIFIPEDLRKQVRLPLNLENQLFFKTLEVHNMLYSVIDKSSVSKAVIIITPSMFASNIQIRF